MPAPILIDPQIRLKGEGVPVRVIGRSRERLQAFVQRGAEPIVSEPSDRTALAKAFQDGTAVYVMLQPGYIPESADFPAYQRAVIDAIVSALVEKRVPRVVVLSGWGANYEKVSSLLDGLLVLEKRIQAIGRLKALVLRPGWFMENASRFIQDIAQTGTASGQLRGDLALPMIATADVGAVAADQLIKGEFGDYVVRELDGPEALSLNQAAAIVGELTGRPGAVYQQISADEARSQLLSWGFSSHMADSIVQMTEDELAAMACFRRVLRVSSSVDIRVLQRSIQRPTPGPEIRAAGAEASGSFSQWYL